MFRLILKQAARSTATIGVRTLAVIVFGVYWFLQMFLKGVEWFCGIAFSVAVLGWLEAQGAPDVTPIEAGTVPAVIFVAYGVVFFGSRFFRAQLEHCWWGRDRIPRDL